MSEQSAIKPIQLASYVVSFEWFEQNIVNDPDHQLDAEHIAEGMVVSGLSRLEVYDGGDIIALYDGRDPDHVTMLVKAPTEAIQREAERIASGNRW